MTLNQKIVLVLKLLLYTRTPHTNILLQKYFNLHLCIKNQDTYFCIYFRIIWALKYMLLNAYADIYSQKEEKKGNFVKTLLSVLRNNMP